MEGKNEKIDLRMINGDLKTFLAESLRVQKIQNDIAGKIKPIQEKKVALLEKPQKNIETIRERVYSFIETNRQRFEAIRTIKSEFGIFGLFKSSGKVVFKGEEIDVIKKLQKSKIIGRNRYIRFRREINKNALLEDYRRGKMKPEQIKQLREIGIEISAGDMPFIRPNIPNIPTIEAQQKEFNEAV